MVSLRGNLDIQKDTKGVHTQSRLSCEEGAEKVASEGVKLQKKRAC